LLIRLRCSQRFGSGAGFSNYFGAPTYQQSAVNGYIASLDGLYNGLYNKSGRGYPDVAAQGNHDATVWGGNISTIVRSNKYSSRDR